MTKYRMDAGRLVEIETTFVPVYADELPTEKMRADHRGKTFNVEVDNRGNVISIGVACSRSDLVVAGETIGQLVDGDPITATYMRTMPFGELAQIAKQQTGTVSVWDGYEDVERTITTSDSDLARVAYAYTTAIGKGSPSPLVDLTERFDLSYSTARNRIRQARERGLLSETEKRKPGGHLTPRAIDILNDERTEG